MQIDDIYGKCEQLKNDLDKESREKKQLLNTVQNILERSRRYFNVQFNTLDDLLRHLQSPHISNELTLPNTMTQSNTTTLANQSKQQDQQLQKKVKHLKKQIKEEQEKTRVQEEACVKLQDEIHRMNKMQQNEKAQYEEQLKLLESNNTKLQNENTNLHTQHNQHVEDFENAKL